MIFGFALFTEVLVRFLALGEVQTHAVIMLPRRTLITADHISLNVLLLFIFATNTADDFFFISILLTRSRGRFGGRFRRLLLGLGFRSLFFGWDVWYQIEILVLAFGGSS